MPLKTSFIELRQGHIEEADDELSSTGRVSFGIEYSVLKDRVDWHAYKFMPIGIVGRGQLVFCGRRGWVICELLQTRIVDWR